MNYKAYLRTPHWKHIRKLAIHFAGNKCQVCGRMKGLDVHHLTYANLGHEKRQDLKVLCRFHHLMAHKRYLHAIIELFKNGRKDMKRENVGCAGCVLFAFAGVVVSILYYVFAGMLP